MRPMQLDGWSFTPDDTYVDLVGLTRATVAVEVGVWRGLSASKIAGALQARGRGGVLFCVDTWLGAIEFWSGQFRSGSKGAELRDLELINDHPTVYWTFLSNMVHANVSEYIVPLPMPSRMAASLLGPQRAGVRADLIHLDAAHEYDDIAEDIAAWLPLLAPCGILLGDDYKPDRWPGVVRAVDELEKRHPELHVSHGGRWGVKWWARRRGCPGHAKATAGYVEGRESASAKPAKAKAKAGHVKG